MMALGGLLRPNALRARVSDEGPHQQCCGGVEKGEGGSSESQRPAGSGGVLWSRAGVDPLLADRSCRHGVGSYLTKAEMGNEQPAANCRGGQGLRKCSISVFFLKIFREQEGYVVLVNHVND